VNQIAITIAAALGGALAAAIAAALPPLEDWDFGDAGAFAFACGVALRLLGLGAKFMLGKVEDPGTGEQNWRIDDARWGEYGALAGGAVGFVLALV